MQVIKRIKADYQSILRAKIHVFLRKSLWLYLLSMFAIASVLPLPTLSIPVSAIIYFAIFLVVILVPVYHLSTVRLVQSLNFDADVEFDENQIIIRHRNKDLIETKDWQWILQISFTGSAVVLTVRQPRTFLIFLNKNNLTERELHFFNHMSTTRYLK